MCPDVLCSDACSDACAEAVRPRSRDTLKRKRKVKTKTASKARQKPLIIKVAGDLPTHVHLTKQHLRAALKAAGYPMTEPWLNQVQEARESLRKLRLKARQQRVVRRLGHCPDWYTDSGGDSRCLRDVVGGIKQARTRVRLPHGAPQDRLECMRHERIEKALRSALRVGVNDKLRIELVEDAAEVGMKTVAAVDWNAYRGRSKGLAMNYRVWHVRVHRQWMTRVQKPGLATIDRRFVLDAVPVVRAVSTHDGGDDASDRSPEGQGQPQPAAAPAKVIGYRVVAAAQPGASHDVEVSVGHVIADDQGQVRLLSVKDLLMSIASTPRSVGAEGRRAVEQMRRASPDYTAAGG